MDLIGSAGAPDASSQSGSKKRGCLRSCLLFFIILIPLCLLVILAFVFLVGISLQGGDVGIVDRIVFCNDNAAGLGDYIEMTINSVGHFNGVEAYNVNYTIDGLGRRVTPVTTADERDRFIAFFGCSYVFGHGVDDNETLPYFAGEMAPRFTPYNYGKRGDGPQQTLERIKGGNLPNEIPEKEGYGVYVFIPHQFERLIGAMPSFNLWTASFPCYELDEQGELVCRGTFRTAHPRRAALYDALWEWPVISWLNITLPLRRYTSEHQRLLTAVIKEAKQAFETQFPGSQFLVMFNYEAGDRPFIFDDGAVAENLSEENIPWIDGCSWLTPEAHQENFLPDHHPRGAMHRHVAETLLNELGIAP